MRRPTDYSFLPQLVEMAQADGGASLPTLSTEALREIRRLMVAGSDSLSRMGGQALGDRQPARRKAAGRRGPAADPTNPQALALQAVAAEES